MIEKYNGFITKDAIAVKATTLYKNYKSFYNDQEEMNSIFKEIGKIKNFLSGYDREALIKEYSDIDFEILQKAIMNLSTKQKETFGEANLISAVGTRQKAIDTIFNAVDKIYNLTKGSSNASQIAGIKSKILTYKQEIDAGVSILKSTNSSEEKQAKENLQNLLKQSFYGDMSKIWGYVLQEDIFNFYVNKELKNAMITALPVGTQQRNIKYLDKDLKTATRLRNQIGDTLLTFTDKGITKQTLISIKSGGMFGQYRSIKSKKLQDYELDRIVTLMGTEAQTLLMAQVFYLVNNKSIIQKDSEEIIKKQLTITQIRSQYLDEFSKILWLVMFKDYFKTTFDPNEFIGLLLAGSKVYTSYELFPTEAKLAEYANKVIVSRTLIYEKPDTNSIYWKNNSVKYLMQYKGFKAKFAISLQFK